MKTVLAGCALFLLFIFFFLYSGCDIQQFSPAINLAPPLGLIAYNTNFGTPSDVILLQFQGDNKESYFSGYVIYISTNTNVATNWINVEYTESNTNIITMPLSPDTSGAAVYYEVISNGIVGPLTLTYNVDYFFYVEAYSSQFNVYSLPSNITNIVYE